MASLLSISLALTILVNHLTTEHLQEPLNIESDNPRLSWVITSDGKGVDQTAYHIIAATTAEKATALQGDLWDTELVNSEQSVDVPYAGRPLKTNERCYWRVQVVTTAGTSAWSDVAVWGKGPEGESYWHGQWIGWDAPFEWDEETTHSRLSARYLRKTFESSKEVKRATLHIAGLGMYELFINGQRIGEQVYAPAPTDYRKEVIYNTFDVTKAIVTGSNAIGVTLGNGRFYTMRQHYKPQKIRTFGYPKLRLDLVIEYTDGSTQRVHTNNSWRLTADGPIRSNNEYDGEDYDARKELGAWTSATYDDSSWLQAQLVSPPDGNVHRNTSENMRVMETFAPVTIRRYGRRTIVDFGQNMAGRVVIRPEKLSAGDTITIRYAEKLTAGGDSLSTANLRDALSRDRYIANGHEQGQPWAGAFSYHGFQYVEVTGMDVTKENITAELIYDAMDDAGTFECSSEVINNIVKAARYGIASNYKGMPVDCPQRNERQGWLGDRVMGAWGEAFLFDCTNLYTKWLKDIRQAQREDGCIPDVAPAFWNYYTDNMTWPAALPVIADMIYAQTGDEEPIRQSYDAIALWLKHMRKVFCKDGLITRDKYGDWCALNATDGKLIATAYYYKACTIMEHLSTIIGRGDERLYDSLAAVTKEAFNRHFLHADSSYYGNNTVTANILPLAFGMVPEEHVEGVQKSIINTILNNDGGHARAGVIGLQWLMRTLTAMGRSDVAFLLATNRTYPSYGYMIDHGATTIWELWNGDTASPKMNSANHVMLLGDFIYWLFADVAGISPSAPGYKKITLKPDFTIANLEHAAATHLTPYGTIESRWTKTLEHLAWDVTIPCNTTATLHLPDTIITLGSGTYHIERDIPHRDPRIISEQFLYNKTSFPECHAATIVETAEGDLVTAFFGGTKERNPDCCIYVCRKEKGSNEWTAPIKAADGIFDDTLHVACWNPVLYRIPGTTELLLYYKIGRSVAEWTGWVVRSNDGGRTWSTREQLPDSILGPIKNKPINVGQRIIAPSSREKGGWRLHFELSDDGGRTWRWTAPPSADSIRTIQPTIIIAPDGHLIAHARTRNCHIATTESFDDGETWTPVTLSQTENNNSGIDAVTMDDSYALVYNNVSPPPGKDKGPRTPLSIATSTNGLSWKHTLTLEDSPISQYSYPSMIVGSDGTLHIVYTWRRQRIKYVNIKL